MGESLVLWAGDILLVHELDWLVHICVGVVGQLGCNVQGSHNGGKFDVVHGTCRDCVHDTVQCWVSVG
jgi:hypothetical protein